MRAVMLHADGRADDVALARGNLESYEQLKELVGGWVETVPIDNSYGAFARTAVLIGNEESKVRSPQMPLNERATELAYGADHAQAKRAMDENRRQMKAALGDAYVELGSGDPREPFLAGPVVVCGLSADGDFMPIPDGLAADLLHDETWACDACGYERNPLNVNECGGCERQRQDDAERIQGQREEVLTLDQYRAIGEKREPE